MFPRTNSPVKEGSLERKSSQYSKLGTATTPSALLGLLQRTVKMPQGDELVNAMQPNDSTPGAPQTSTAPSSPKKSMTSSSLASSNDDREDRDKMSLKTIDYEGDEESSHDEHSVASSVETSAADLGRVSRSTGGSPQASSVYRKPPKSTIGDFKARFGAASNSTPTTSLTFATAANGKQNKQDPKKEKSAPQASSHHDGDEDVAKLDMESVKGPLPSVLHKVTIPQLNPLRPTLTVETMADMEGSAGGKDLTAEEFSLLEKLEQQNTMLTTDPKSASHDALRDLFARAKMSFHRHEASSVPETSSALRKGTTAADEFGGDGVLIDDEDAVDWDFWGKLLNDFDNVIKKQSRVVVKKIHAGLPKSLRGTIWQQLSRIHPLTNERLRRIANMSSTLGSPKSQPADGTVGSTSPVKTNNVPTLEELYAELLKQSSPYEKMIIRDLARTFPKHEFFKSATGVGQESLFNVMKAYSLYDPEVGYCQGLSFIVGSLLLNVSVHVGDFFFFSPLRGPLAKWSCV
jgi:hypothetical protein